MGCGNAGLEHIVDGYKGPVAKTKEWLNEKRWELTKIVFGTYLASKAYFGIENILEKLGALAQNPESGEKEFYDMVVKPAIENGWTDIYKGAGIAFLTYFILHHLGKEMSDEEMNRVIEEWKIVHESHDKPSDALIAVESALVGAAAASVPYAISAATGTPYPSMLVVAYLAGAGILGANYALRYSHYLRKPRLKNVFDFMSNGIDAAYHTLRKNYNALLKSTVQFADSFTPGRRKIRSGIADDLVKAGRLEEAMEMYRSEIENFRIIEKRTLVDAVAEPIAYFLEGFIKSDDDVAKAFRHLPEKPSRFLAELENAARDEWSLDLRALNAIAHSRLYQGKDREEKTMEVWGEVVQGILAKPEHEFEPLTGTSNEVLLYKPENRSLVSKLLLFKRGQEQILKDYLVNLFSDNSLRKEVQIRNLKKSVVPEPIGCYQGDGTYLDILRLEESPNLDSLSKEDLARCLPTVIHNLAALQGIVTRNLGGNRAFSITYMGNEQEVDLGRFDYSQELGNRVFNRFGHNEYSRIITLHLMQHLQKKLMRESFFIQGDFYKTNALQAGVILDFERSTTGDPASDLALILLSTSFQDDENLITSFADGLAHYSHLDVPLDSIRNSLHAHLIFYGFCLTGSRIHHGDPKAAEDYMEKTVELTEQENLTELRDNILHYAETAFMPNFS